MSHEERVLFLMEEGVEFDYERDDRQNYDEYSNIGCSLETATQLQQTNRCGLAQVQKSCLNAVPEL